MTGATNVTTQTAQGILLGAAVGDALGWPQEARGGLIGGQKERDRAVARLEFKDWTRYAGHYSSRYHDPVRSGEYSDDTQLLLATARACLAGEHWWERLTEVELPTWPVYQRGGGGAVLSAAASWAEGRPPWRGGGPGRAQAAEKRYRGAGANGVAMRIAPHVLWAKDPDDLIQRVIRDGITTHGHPRALVGALVYAFALFHAASSRGTHGFGNSVEAASTGLIDISQVLPALPPDWGSARELEAFAATWQETNKETSQLLALIRDSLHRGALSNPDETLEWIGCTDPKVNGAGTISAAAAVYLASRFAARSRDGLLSAAFLRKGDTDTLASLTAALLGALHGTNWLEDLAGGVQDASYIAGIAEHSALRVPAQQAWPTRRPRALRDALTNALHGTRYSHGEFPDGRNYRLTDSFPLQDGRVMRAWLLLDDGQSVLVDLHAKPVAGTTAGRPLHSPPPERIRHAADEPGIEFPSAETSHDSTTSVQLAGPPQTIESSRREATVILATRSLTRSAAFYARLTGRNILARAGTAEIAPGVLLHQVAGDVGIEASSAMVHITVEDLPAAIRRLGLNTNPADDAPATVELRDPDGRMLRISQGHAG